MSGSEMKFSQLKVGMVAFAGLAVFLFFIIIVGSRDNLFGSNYDIKMFVTDSEGLVSGSKVSAGGLKIGYVSDLEFAKHAGQNGIIITLRIEEQFRELVTQSSVAMIKSVGMLGDRYVHIQIGEASEPPVAEGSFIAVEIAFSLERAGSDLTAVLDNLNTGLINLRAITDSIRMGKGVAGKLITESDFSRRFEQTMMDLHHITSEIKQGRGTLGKLINDDKLYAEIKKTGTNMAAITGHVREGKGTLGKLYHDDSLYTHLKSSSIRLDSLLEKANRDSSTLGQLLTNGSLYREIQKTTENLNALVKDIQEHPEKYVNISVF